MYVEAAARRFGDRVVQLAQAVEHLLVLVGQVLEGPLVILEAVGQDDADDPPLLVPEEVVQAVGPAGKLAAQQAHHVGERLRTIRGHQPQLERVILVQVHVLAEHGMEVEPAEVDDHEASLGLVPGAARPGSQPADGQVTAAPRAYLLVEDLQVVGVNAAANRVVGRPVDQADGVMSQDPVEIDDRGPDDLVPDPGPVAELREIARRGGQRLDERRLQIAVERAGECQARAA